MNTPTVSYTHRQVINTLRKAAELASEVPIDSTMTLVLYAAGHVHRHEQVFEHFTHIMYSRDPASDGSWSAQDRVIGLLFAAEFTRAEGLL